MTTAERISSGRARPRARIAGHVRRRTNMNALTTGFWALTMTFALAACGSSGGGSGGSASTGDAQTPPQGAAAVQAWLAAGDYKSWSCETAVHAARSPSPHGFNRVCSNDVIAAHARESGAWPKGAAAVKELFAAAG